MVKFGGLDKFNYDYPGLEASFLILEKLDQFKRVSGKLMPNFHLSYNLDETSLWLNFESKKSNKKAVENLNVLHYFVKNSHISTKKYIFYRQLNAEMFLWKYDEQEEPNME